MLNHPNIFNAGTILNTHTIFYVLQLTNLINIGLIQININDEHQFEYFE